ncbi:MAG: glycosyltransferase family 4 protein [Armatimonadota bacterium]
MKVLVVSLSSPDRMCRRLASAGLELSALFPRTIDLEDFGGVRRPPSATPYELHTAPVLPRRPYVYSRWVRGLTQTLQAVQPNVVLYVGEPSELAAAQVATQTRRVCPGARLGAYVFENIQRTWRGKLKWLRGIAQNTVTSTLDFAVCASSGAAEILASCGVPRDRLEVVYPETEPDIFSPRNTGPLRDELGLQGCTVVGYVGRIVYEKGLDILVEALSHLPNSYRLLMVGSGRYLDELKQQIEELDLACRVVHVPRVPQPEVADYLNSMDIFVLPSRTIAVWQEQFGRVLPQAMLCETAVIGSDSGAIPEVIGAAGLVFPEGDPERLAESIKRLGEDSAYREEVAGRGRERALEKFVDTYRTRLAPWLKEAAKFPLRADN